MIKVRTREDLARLRRDEGVEEIYVARRISKGLATTLLSLFPNLKRIHAPRSVIELSSPKVLEALRRVGVEIVETGRRPGRPPKYDEETLKLIVEKYKSGEAVSEISRSTGIPIRTVYHILRRLGLR
ncbi:MAG: helix-turn-helix domain-containing protein [Candidatus Diapherotrites archaeon]|nr:helix-turn-helix domain-containing protein [Candidatus Diapherotrites archaeon]